MGNPFPPKIQTRRQLLDRVAPVEDSWCGGSAQDLHPMPPCPPCPSRSGILIRALASESDGQGSGASAPTLANCENLSKLLSLSEPQFHHLSNDAKQ